MWVRMIALGILPGAVISTAAERKTEALVMQLGDDRFRVREESASVLISRGVEVLPALLEAAVSEEPEVRRRCRMILDGYLVESDVEVMLASQEVLRKTADGSGSKVAVLAAKLLKELKNLNEVGRERLEKLGASVSKSGTEVTFGTSWKGTDAEVGLLRLLPTVKSVIFRAAEISDGVTEHFVHLPALTFLSFNRVALSDAGAQQLEGLTQLTDLRLRGTKVTNAGLECVKGMTGLHTISIEETTIDDEGLQHLVGLEKLEKLYAGRCGVKGPGLKLLWEKSPLVYLSLEGSKFNDEGIKFLKGFSQLETLGLDGTKVGDAGVSKLVDFKELRVLWLSGSEVSDDAVEDLKKLTGLSKLYLKNTNISEAKADELKKVLEEVDVTHSLREGPEVKPGEVKPDAP